MDEEKTSPLPNEVITRALEEVKKSPRKKWLLLAAAGLLVLVILLLSVAAFNQGEKGASSKSQQQYQSTDLGFTIHHPANWVVIETAAPSGPDIIIAEQAGPAFVRIRGFLDVNLTSTEAVLTSIDQYQKMISLQPGVRINSMQIEDTDASVTEFIMTGEFPVADTTYGFEERGMLTATGRVLLMRAADLPAGADATLPIMRDIMNSFTLEQQASGAMLSVPTAFASDSPPPLASIGNVTYNITDFRGNPVEIADTRDRGYAASLRVDLVNAGVRLSASGHMREQVIQRRQEDNQLNFWGYKQYSADLPEATYKIDARINVRHRDESGDNQDIIISLRIYDSQTGQLVSTTSVERENTPRLINEQYVGGEPIWWEKYITGYGREITYEDALRTAISEAANGAAGKLSTLSSQEIESDAARFARSIKESGYIPIVPDETRRQSEGRDEQVGQNLEHDSDRDPNCPYFYATGTIDGPRTCFQTQAELNAALGVDAAGNPLPLPDPADLMRQNSTPSDIYIDQNLVDYTNWLGTVDGDPAASRQNYIDNQRENYRINPVSGYSSEQEYIDAFTRALDQALSSGNGSAGNTDSSSTTVYDGPDTYQGPGTYSTESR